ncbi:thymidylate synthase ThyX [Clostridium felsineum]|uniref:thymidylate synthase ThyX n=1 Tax=Clostridium felsineum TaxID=36839 RepID=UPI0011155713|nr:thymidylate synthase ThyX [Clostridium felsineum]
MAEHSPIRKLTVEWKWEDLYYWVSTHFVRHWLGIVHFVGTQRTDRTGEERNSKEQDAPVVHEAEANAQAMINISRKRLCYLASPETRLAWEAVKKEVQKVEPELASCMVKECTYRGFCPEFISCNYHKTPQFQKELTAYRNGINGYNGHNGHE